MKHFIVTREHIALLQAASLVWNEDSSGAPMIDPVQPYKWCTWIIEGIARTLGIEPEEGDDYSDEQMNRMMRLHKETLMALKIFLSTGKMEPGAYIKNGLLWERMGE